MVVLSQAYKNDIYDHLSDELELYHKRVKVTYMVNFVDLRTDVFEIIQSYALQDRVKTICTEILDAIEKLELLTDVSLFKVRLDYN